MPSPLPQAQFIDIADLSKQGYATGADFGPIDFYAGMRNFDAAFTPLSRAEILDAIDAIDENGEGWLERRIRKIKNQGNEGSCVYNMLGQMAEIAGNKQFGDDDWIELSAMSGYRWNGSSPGSGSSVPGSLTWIKGTGLLPARTEANLKLVTDGKFQHTHPATGYYEKFQPNWQETAKFFRVDEFLQLSTVESWFTALAMGFPCGGGRNSHAICHCRPLRDGNKLLSLYVNSWGEWGSSYDCSPLSGKLQGFAVDSESLVRTMVSRGAFCLCTMLIPPWHLNLGA